MPLPKKSQKEKTEKITVLIQDRNFTGVFDLPNGKNTVGTTDVFESSNYIDHKFSIGIHVSNVYF